MKAQKLKIKQTLCEWCNYVISGYRIQLDTKKNTLLHEYDTQPRLQGFFFRKCKKAKRAVGTRLYDTLRKENFVEFNFANQEVKMSEFRGI